MQFENPYEILGLEPEASDEEVKAAYEKLLENEEKKEDAEKAFRQITELREAQREEKPEETAEEEKPQEEASDAEKPEEEKPQETAEEKPEEKKEEMKKGASAGQIALGVLAVVALAAILIALIVAALGGNDKKTEAVVPGENAVVTEQAATNPIETTEATVPEDGNPDDETCKGNYSGSDEEVKAAAANIVASIPGYELTNAQLQIYYWMGIQSYMQNAGAYAQFMGLDVSKPLATQPCPLEEGKTWQQFFLKQALLSWQNYQAMAAEAEAAGREMDESLQNFLKELPDQMEKQAKENGFADAKAMLANNVGAGAEIEDYLHFMEIYNTGYGYFNDEVDKAAPSDEQLEAFYKEHEEELNQGGISKDNKVCTARHILITPEDTESEESWAAAEKTAKELLDQFLAGDKTEESFGKLATEHTMDPGSKDNGGLYQDFAQGQMVQPFDQWCFDAARKTGDTDVVKTDYGYHVMYFKNTRPIWKEQTTQAYIQEAASKIIEQGTEKYPLDIHYGEIVLGELKAQ